MIKKKILAALSLLIAGTILMSNMTVNISSADAEYQKRYEAEDGVMKGDIKSESSRRGYSGKGYVTGFTQKENNKWSKKVDIPKSGHYKVKIIAASDSYKANNLIINGEEIGTFSTSGTGKFEELLISGIYLEKGENEISIGEVWGWFDLDCIEIIADSPISDDYYKNISTKLISKNANRKTKKVMKYLVDIYGEYTLAGQYASHNKDDEVELLYKETGKYPAIRGFDFIFCSPNAGWKVDYELDRIKEWNEKGGLTTVSWHWAAPINEGDFYTEKTSFDLSKAVTDMDISKMKLSEIKKLYEQGKISEECYMIVSDIDKISADLLELQKEGVTVLWRPLHEAAGGWFWWGASGKDAYLWLWKLMVERQNNYHKLKNLIWVWNGQDKEWYPGDNYCDIVGIDIYATEHNYNSQANSFKETADCGGGKKLTALTENGVIPDPKLMTRDNAKWLWFNVWNGEFIKSGDSLNNKYTEISMIKKVYKHSEIITLDELPKF